MNIDLESNVCLICLDECKTEINFECCGNYKIHKQCYNKWKETNETCLICRNQVITPPQFITYYITLSRIKIITSVYCIFSFTALVYIFITCDFKEDYCDLN
jgi:hypothetical protein